MLRTFMFVFPVYICQVGLSIIPCVLDWEVGVRGAVIEKFGCKSVDDNGGGLNV